LSGCVQDVCFHVLSPPTIVIVAGNGRAPSATAANRRLIFDRTAKGPPTLAAPQRVYRDRTGRASGVAARHPLNLTDYLSPEEMVLDDDNDRLVSMIDPSGVIEVLAWTLIYMMRTPAPALVRPLFSALFRSYPE
jgi:hypothetical protein